MSDRLRQTLESSAFDEFKVHCQTDRTIEMCGLFVLSAGEIKFVPCENVAYDKKNSFLIHPAEFVKCLDEGDAIAVGHSHVTAPAEPSMEDKTHSENCLLPFVILQVETGDVATYEPSGDPMPLIGRTWRLGVSDCYSIVRDYYALHGVELGDYVRNERSCLDNDDRFVRLYAENGFVDVTGQTPRVHDMALIQLLSNVPNHVAVFVDDNLILHHIQNRLSCRDPYGGYWRRHTFKLLRHKKWL